MRKTIVMALALVAGAFFSTAEAVKKKNKVVTFEQPVAQPVVLGSTSDSLSYAGGQMLTNGLVPFLEQQGVDTTYMADFIRGFQQMVAAKDDPKQKAYAMGMDIAKQLQERMLPSMTKSFEDTPDSIITALLFRGFTDALQKDTSVMTVTTAEQYFQQVEKRDAAIRTEQQQKAGRDFLAENAKKEGVVTLPSGLQYKVLKEGTGVVPTKDDKVKVNYEGRLIDGTVFDASSKHGNEPAEFTPGQVIKGWTEALTMMPVGSKWQLYIPYELAYGERGAGSDIKPYSTLVFDVELVDIVKE